MCKHYELVLHHYFYGNQEEMVLFPKEAVRFLENIWRQLVFKMDDSHQGQFAITRKVFRRRKTLMAIHSLKYKLNLIPHIK